MDKSISKQQAAELLSLYTRQISRLKKGIIESGAESLIHKNKGRKPAHAVLDETKENILAIHSKPEFYGINFLHFKDILNEYLFGYLEMMRQCCLDFGVPQYVYSDRHTIFRSSKKGLLTVEEPIHGKYV